MIRIILANFKSTVIIPKPLVIHVLRIKIGKCLKKYFLHFQLNNHYLNTVT